MTQLPIASSCKSCDTRSRRVQCWVHVATLMIRAQVRVVQELPEPPPPQEWPPFDLRPPPRPHDRPNLLPAQASHQCGGSGVCIVPPLHMQPLLVSSDAVQTSTSHRRFLSMPLPVFPAGVVLLLTVAVVASLVVLRTRARRKRECRDRVADTRHALFTIQVLPVLRRLQFGCLLNAASSICLLHQSELWRAALPSNAMHRAGRVSGWTCPSPRQLLCIGAYPAVN